MTSNIVEFLEARIAEDEAVALNATGTTWVAEQSGGDPTIYAGVLDTEGYVEEPSTFVAQTAYDTFYSTNSWQDAAFISLFDPARVLAECKAKRALIAHVVLLSECAWGEESRDDTAWDGAKILASVYADHPDFDPAWAQQT